MSIKELEDYLGVTRTAVRQQLVALESLGLVDKKLERRGVGRPKGFYYLTEEGHRLFAREYEPLLRLLLEELASSEDPGQLRTLIGRVSRKMADGFEPLPEEATLDERVASLVEKFKSRGHLAEAEAVPEGIFLQMCWDPRSGAASAYWMSAILTVPTR
jgi:predicted ArsR family transcriptional regulator